MEGDEDTIDHYEQLSGITGTIPKHDVFLLIGDCNTHLGPEDTLYTFHETAILSKPIVSLPTLDSRKKEENVSPLCQK